MARNALKLSTMVGEIFEICISKMARNALKLSTAVGENFLICISEMAKNALKTPWLKTISKFVSLKWLEMH